MEVLWRSVFVHFTSISCFIIALIKYINEYQYRVALSDELFVSKNAF